MPDISTEPTCQQFSVARDVRLHSEALRGRQRSEAPDAGEDLVENDGHAAPAALGRQAALVQRIHQQHPPGALPRVGTDVRCGLRPQAWSSDQRNLKSEAGARSRFQDGGEGVRTPRHTCRTGSRMQAAKSPPDGDSW